MPVDTIPPTDSEMRINRKKQGDNAEFINFAKYAYDIGYNEPSFVGSEFVAGGQEQPLSFKTVKNFAKKLMGFLKLSHPYETIRIKWVSESFLSTQSK